MEVTVRGRRPRSRPGLRVPCAKILELRELEHRLARIVREAGFPRPRFNAHVGRYEVDVLWERERVVVETDGWAAHGHRGAFERDRARDAELQALGYAVLRFTWRQVMDQPLLVAARIAQVLAGR